MGRTLLGIRQGDITKVDDADAIVNAANKTLLGGGGVDGAIHKAAGVRLRLECLRHLGCKTGKAKITAAYNLPCRYVIHTVGPVWHGGNRGEERLLEECYVNSLQVAMNHGIRRIAFPSISTGAFHFPKERAAGIALQTVYDFVKECPEAFDRIEWILFDRETWEVYQEKFDRYR